MRRKKNQMELINIKNAEYLIKLANKNLENNEIYRSEILYRKALRIFPNAPEIYNNLGTIMREQGRIGEAQILYNKALELRENYELAHSNLLFLMQYKQGQTLKDLRSAHEDWVRQYLKNIIPVPPELFIRNRKQPIVIGLVSPDLYAHPVGIFLLSWLENHNRKAFRIIIYTDSLRDDPIAHRIRSSVERWHFIGGKNDKEVAKQIAEDQVDLLFDLAGHTAGNRLKMFAHRAAPFQISWLGYSATTAVPAMDAVLMDAYIARPGVEKYFTEQVVRIEGLRFCYTPPSYAPIVKPAPVLQNKYITFGSFNNLAKINQDVIKTWSDILNSVPNSKLILKWKSLDDVETKKRIFKAFEQNSVETQRIELRGWSSHQKMLDEYGDIDIALDPFPFSGGLTSCDALFMGVPVLTLPSELPISRQTGSFLDELGMQDLIANNLNEYINKAVDLTKKIDLLRYRRQTLRNKFLGSRLCDGPKFARSIENALTDLISNENLFLDIIDKHERLESTMTTAIYYHPEAYTTSGPKLMGRNAAGESFLRGFVSHSSAASFCAQVQKPEHARHFAATVASFGRTEPVRAVDKNSMGALSQAGVVYYPGPGIAEHAFHRAAYGHSAWSLCGITHTTSSAGAMDALADLITSPVQPWDAVICTSTAVKDNVIRLLQAQLDYLKDRLGISRVVQPLLPVIPLGIHTADFAFSSDQKAAARAALGVSPDTLVVMFMGRLSFHAKAHPLAMYQALEAAAKATDKSVVLVECGWHANEFIEKAYADAARLACPNVRVLTLDGRKAEARQTAWAGADVFCSLSDNIQETFGIVPIEAMAAGLPVVVSDWDGYKDTVRDGVDGFRIPTVMPLAGLGGDLALRHALEVDTYDMYCGHTCSLVAVDVQVAAAAFEKLFNSSELRRQMGEAGRVRAIEVFDWKPIIGQYEALWAKQTELRLAAKAEADKNGIKPLVHPWPARMDPFHAFASYPTQALAPQTLLALVDADAELAVQRALAYRQLAMVDFAKVILPSEAEIVSVLNNAAQPQTAQALVAGIARERQAFVFRSLAWLLKLGVLRVVS